MGKGEGGKGEGEEGGGKGEGEEGGGKGEGEEGGGGAKWLNCTWLHLVQLPSHFFMQLYQNCTQKHVITYTNYEHVSCARNSLNIIAKCVSLIYLITRMLLPYFRL